MERKERKAAKKLEKFNRLTGEDVSYRGPLSYRAFKALGWLCIVISQVVVLLNLEAKLDPTMVEYLSTPISVLGSIADLALPFLLIANFALILSHSEGFKSQLLRYGGLTAAVAVISIVLFSRYGIGTVAIVTEDRALAFQMIQESFWKASAKQFFAFNIFVDLFLCSLLMFFLNHRPQKVFTGKKLLIFRAFALFPILYEALSIVLKLMASYGKLQLPLLVFPFLTVKPPLTFLVFIVLAVFIKRREMRFRRNGKSHEEYEAFLKTNRNSLQFSVYTAITLAIAGLVDFIATIIFVLARAGLETAAEDIDVLGILQQSAGLGFGESISLLLLAPLLLLFSYTRTHKNKSIDLLIPAAGAVGIVLAYIEGLYQFLLMVPDMVAGLHLDQRLDEVLMLIAMFAEY